MAIRLTESRFLGVRFTVLSITEVVSIVLSRSESDPFVDIVTPNVDHVVRINERPDRFAALYDRAWLRLNDSRVLQLLARLRGLRLPAVPGADLAPALLADRRLPRDAPLCMVGGEESVAIALRARFGLSNLTHLPAPMGLAAKPAEIDALARAVVAEPRRLVFLCVGSPQQEMIAAAIKALGQGTGVGLCVGAALEFAAGAKRRAPLAMRALCVEWLFRLCCEPKRLYRRYLVDGPKILVYYWREMLRPAPTFVVLIDDA